MQTGVILCYHADRIHPVLSCKQESCCAIMQTNVMRCHHANKSHAVPSCRQTSCGAIMQTSVILCCAGMRPYGKKAAVHPLHLQVAPMQCSHSKANVSGERIPRVLEDHILSVEVRSRRAARPRLLQVSPCAAQALPCCAWACTQGSTDQKLPTCRSSASRNRSSPQWLARCETAAWRRRWNKLGLSGHGSGTEEGMAYGRMP